MGRLSRPQNRGMSAFVVPATVRDGVGMWSNCLHHQHHRGIAAMRERIYRTEALIVKRSDLGEADRIVLIATPGGNRRVMARGVRKTTSRLAGHLELFTHTLLLLARGRSLDVVTQSHVLHAFPLLRRDFARLSHAYYVAELYQALVGNYETDTAQPFALLVQAYQALERTRTIDLLLSAYELHLLEYSGYRPHFHHCAQCQQVLTEDATTFSPALGGMLCAEHASRDPQAQRISYPAFKLLRFLQTHALDAVQRLTISEAVCTELTVVLRGYLRQILTRDLSTLPFLDSLLPHGQRESDTRRTKEFHHGIE